MKYFIFETGSSGTVTFPDGNVRTFTITNNSSPGTWYCRLLDSVDNAECYEKFGVDRHDINLKFGFKSGGRFPFCESKEQVIEVLQFIEDVFNKRAGSISKKSKTKSKEKAFNIKIERKHKISLTFKL